jgi:hypothetical protein
MEEKKQILIKMVTNKTFICTFDGFDRHWVIIRMEIDDMLSKCRYGGE